MCNDFAFEKSEDVCVGVGVGRFVVVGSGVMTEYHCGVGEKMNLVEDLGCVSLESVTSVSSSVSLESFGGPLGFDLSVGRMTAPSFAFPLRFFFEGPECRSFKNAETSTARLGYFNRLEDEKRSSR